MDRKHPGWEHEIDLQRLRFPSVTDCVLGQLYGHVGDGYNHVLPGAPYTDNEATFGFNRGPEGDFDDLTGAWRDEIKARRLEVQR